MIKSKIRKVLFFGLCLTVLSSSLVFASGGGSQPSIGSADAPDTAVSDSDPDSRAFDEDVLKKQREIDQFLFEDHAEEINNMDFKVTHTGPSDGYIEIGITPYTEENAKYLYDLFGDDQVKVIDGNQAVLYQTSEASDGIEVDLVSANDDQTSESNAPWIYIIIGALLLIIAGGMFAKRKKNK